jgi:hypothetical protein
MVYFFIALTDSKPQQTKTSDQFSVELLASKVLVIQKQTQTKTQPQERQNGKSAKHHFRLFPYQAARN